MAYIIVLIFHFFVFRELKELRCQMPLTFMSMVQLGRYKSSQMRECLSLLKYYMKG